MTRRSYDARRNMIFAAYPEIWMVKVGAAVPQDHPVGILPDKGNKSLLDIEDDESDNDQVGAVIIP